ncbi:MAG: hypothetical protein ACTS4W_01850 [Candidatus Hodgkinia cicadicola]
MTRSLHHLACLPPTLSSTPSAANPRSSFASTTLTLLPGRRVHVLHLFSKTCPSKFVNLYQVFD